MKTAIFVVLLSLPVGAQDWPVPVGGFREPTPGEHPRLLFRKADLPELRKVAKTPEGRAILARLRTCLNGSDGESMPKHKNPMTSAYGKKGGPKPGKQELPTGTYSMSHAAGYGFLYQITGDRKYADLGRECFEWAFQGVRDRDREARYSFKAPGGALRAGPSIGWTALGYDLCYDGWDPDFRKKVALAIQDYDEGKNTSLEELARGSRHHPGSNHWGMQVGGAAMALMAIKNDPGIDMGRVSKWIVKNREAMIRNMTQGFGDGGFFAEGDGTGSMSSHIAFLTGLQAWRVAGGQDYVTPRPNAQWMALKWIFLTVFRGGKPDFWPQRGGYPHNIWDRDGLSGAGYFGISMGASTPEQRRALLWVYEKHLKAQDDRNATPFDTPSPYPHHAICSFVNWPWGEKGVNPADMIPRNYRDTKWKFYAFRNRWQDEDDIVISTLTKQAKGFMKAPADGKLKIAAFGRKQDWGRLSGIEDWKPAADGSAILALSGGESMAIDFSGASGAEGMIVATGGAAGPGTQVSVDGKDLTFLFLTKGAPPAPKVQGDRVVVGKQMVTLDGGRIVLGRMADPR